MTAVTDGPVELTVDHVRLIFNLSAASAAEWHPLFRAYCDPAGINTILRLSAFCAQVGHESAQLQVMSENLNYSADRLLVVFPKYFNATNVQSYARNPEAIASRTYANRMGNSNEDSKEGYKYRGRGLIQLTGKSTYQACDRTYPCLDNPDVLTTKDGAVASAVWYWNHKGLNVHADRGDFDRTTYLINGGNNGAADRRAKYAYAIKVLTGVERVNPIETSKTETPEVDPKVTTDVQLQTTQPARKGSFGEPDLRRAPVYPWNSTFVSRSGHVMECDDTPGAERLFQGHRTGTYWTFLPDGSATYKTVLDRSDITLGDQSVYVQGDQTNFVGGQVFYRVGSDYVLKLGGMFFVEGQRAQFNVPVAAFRDQLLANYGQFKSLTCENIAELSARHAISADVAASLGGSGGRVVSALSESLDVAETGSLSFKKPVQHTSPLGLAAGTSTGMPSAAANVNAVMVLVTAQTQAGQPRTLVYSDGVNWRSVKTDEIVIAGD